MILLEKINLPIYTYIDEMIKRTIHLSYIKNDVVFHLNASVITVHWINTFSYPDDLKDLE